MRDVLPTLMMISSTVCAGITVWMAREMRRLRVRYQWTRHMLRAMVTRLMRDSGVLVCDGCGIPIAPHTDATFRLDENRNPLAFHQGHDPLVPL